jgi:hypothetical protein
VKQQVWQCGCGATEHFGRGRCQTCYSQHRAKEIAYGRWEPDRVDATPAREHLARLRAAGLRPHHIAQLGGFHDPAVTRVEGEHAVSRDTEAAILAIAVPETPAEVLPDTAYVPIHGAQRRIQALVAAGHTQTYLSQRLGMKDPCSMASLVGRVVPAGTTGESITVGRERLVRELFDELQMVPGTSARARNHGAARSWALPWEWDEDQIDRPDGTPTLSQRTAGTDYHDAIAERHEHVLSLLQHHTGPEVADLVGITPRSVERIKAEHHRRASQVEEVMAVLDEDDTEVIELTEDE